MGILHLDVVYGSDKTKFAKLDLKEIGKLTTSKPLSGYGILLLIMK